MSKLHQVVPMLRSPFSFPKELLILGHLDDKRHVERFLEPLRHHEGDEVAQVHRQGRGPAARVEVEGLPLLHEGAEPVQVAVGVEDGPAQPGVHHGDAAPADGQALDPRQQLVRDDRGPEVPGQLLVVDLAAHLHGVDDHLRLRLLSALLGERELLAVQRSPQPVGGDRRCRQVRQLGLAERLAKPRAEAPEARRGGLAQRAVRRLAGGRRHLLEAGPQRAAEPRPVDHPRSRRARALPRVGEAGLRGEGRLEPRLRGAGGPIGRRGVHAGHGHPHRGAVQLLHGLAGRPVLAGRGLPGRVRVLHGVAHGHLLLLGEDQRVRLPLRAGLHSHLESHLPADPCRLAQRPIGRDLCEDGARHGGEVQLLALGGLGVVHGVAVGRLRGGLVELE
mmetsp:Transcript_115965/g.361229  ORF Transcript_115965/g.361229 Transcript_115965/m.361229 type:complete len:391 (+) Transcript_115965:861-2033(+)